ncbi:MAG TPA: S-methyl-5'-thioadenosine phosphorylase [Dissulfurispiraceae bacterium]|nr:S-methyl-5'-thioadenosine phosphorylase [Dissulfurispiraceae bacterium]
MKIGLIGGSGVYQMDGLNVCEEISADTPYGVPSAPVTRCELDGHEIFFLPRHGKKHTIPPHKINYRANISAFRRLGVTRILSIGAVGGMNEDWAPGTIVIPNQIIDMTHGARQGTFFDEGRVVHIDFSQPYCMQMRTAVLAQAAALGEPAVDGGTYICTNGPRLESAAEIRFYKAIGAHVVGMTAMPEAALVREAEMCYAGICIVTNSAAGLKNENLTATEVIVAMNDASERLRLLLRAILPAIHPERPCACGNALSKAGI